VPIVTKLPDGRIIVKESFGPADRLDAGVLNFVVTFTGLKKVEEIIDVNLVTDPVTNATPQEYDKSANVVGMTVYVGAGTTVSGEVIALGI